MKNVILILLNMLIPLIHGDNNIRCKPSYGSINFTVCFNDSELIHVNQTNTHENNVHIGDRVFISIGPNAFQDLSITKLSLSLGHRRDPIWNVIDEKLMESVKIQPTAFKGLQNLKSLKIKFAIWQLEYSVFAALKSLESLEMYSCNLIFANGSFTGLSKLKFLILRFIDMFEMLPGIFTGLDKLKILRLHDTKIKIIRNNVFNHMKYLDLLDLSWNKIETIEAGAFDGMSLKSLRLIASKLTVISVGMFDGASIGTLQLNYNPIHQIEPNAFVNSSIKELHYYGEYISIDKKMAGLEESTVLFKTLVLD